MTRNLPPPQVQAFVVCREITQDDRTGEIVIVGPVSHVPITEFPAVIRLVRVIKLQRLPSGKIFPTHTSNPQPKPQ